MNILSQHVNDKPLSTFSISKTDTSQVISIRLLKDGELKEHKTPVQATLICLEGKTVYENKRGVKETLETGDYIIIEPMIEHWLKAEEESSLLLIK
jgi:quercetin dioxygenase-like cupin family protein